MADITDVMTKMAAIVDAAIYPNGDTQPSAMPNGAAVKIGQGWPLPASLDADLAAGRVTITIFPLSGSATPTNQILDETYVISPAVVNLTAGLAADVISASGTPAPGEFITAVCDDSFVYSATGPTVAAIMSALAAQAQANYPGATAGQSTVTIPVARSIVMRQGGVGAVGKVIWRQRSSIMVTVWAPNDTLRTAATVLADVALKKNIKIRMPDTSQCILRYLRTMVSDQMEKANLYRRDLIFDAEFATVEQFAGVTVTSTQISMVNQANNDSAIATALT